MGETRKEYEILVRLPQGERPFEKLKRKWRIIIKCILMKLVVSMWTRVSRFKIWSTGGLLCIWWWTL